MVRVARHDGVVWDGDEGEGMGGADHGRRHGIDAT